MGTNYYYSTDVCPLCGHSDNWMHIGKSSGGWCFSLHVMPDEDIYDLGDWKQLWSEGVIKDEYDRWVSPEEMVKIITERHSEKNWDCFKSPFYGSEQEFHKNNDSQRGPNNLVRHQLSDRCIKHGQGTWDCIIGEFA